MLCVYVCGLRPIDSRRLNTVEILLRAYAVTLATQIRISQIEWNFLIFIKCLPPRENAILKTSRTLLMKNNGASAAGMFIIKFDGKAAKRPK